MKLILTLTLSIIAFAVFSQDSLSRNARSFRLYSGAPYQRIGSTDDWYNPDFEIGFDVSHSLRIKNRIYLSMGLGANFSQYRSDPYVRTWTTISYSPLSGSTVYHNSDDFERQTIGRFYNLTIPLQLEYMPLGKWKPYCRVGALFQYEFFYKAVDAYANTNRRIDVNSYYPDQEYLYGADYLLSGIASGGIKYSKGDLDLLFGLTSQIGFYDFGKTVDVERVAIGAEFSIRKTIPSTDFPHRELDASGAIKKENLAYLYVEVFGSGGYGSLNYERTLVRNKSLSINGKVGIGAIGPGSLDLTVPIGVSWISGQKNALEVGFDVVPVISSMDDSYFAPRLGYRASIGKKMLLRLTAVGWREFDYGEFRVVPGISIGGRL